MLREENSENVGVGVSRLVCASVVVSRLVACLRVGQFYWPAGATGHSLNRTYAHARGQVNPHDHEHLQRLGKSPDLERCSVDRE